MTDETQPEHENFRVDLQTDTSRAILSLVGELDLDGIAHFEEALERAVALDPGQLVVDFTELQFVDSTGLSAIVTAMIGEERRGRSLQACGLRGQVDRAVDLIGIRDRLELIERPRPS